MKKRGLTLAELLLVVGILALVLAAVAPFVRTSANAWEKDSRLVRMIQEARSTLELIRLELREAPFIADADFTGGTWIKYQVADIILDDGQAEFSQTGFTAGTISGGHGDDYQVTTSTAAVATYYPFFLVAGAYDIYARWVSDSGDTNTQFNAVTDTGTTSFTVNQSQNQGRWVKVAHEVSFATTDASSVDQRIEITGANITPGERAIADAIRLIYKGSTAKEIFFASNQIYLGSDPEVNPPTPSEKLLSSNAYQAGTTPFLQFFQSDGVTPATTAEDVRLVRVSFEVRDPLGRVPPYRISTLIDIPGQDRAQRRVVINEVHIQAPRETLAFDNFDGLINNMDNDTYGWATSSYKYGFLSMMENLDDGETTPAGWFAGGVGSWTTPVDATPPKPAGNRAFSGTGNGTNNLRNNRYFRESSVNYIWELDFRVAAAGAAVADWFGTSRQSTFALYLRAENPADAVGRVLFVELFRQTGAGGGPRVRLAKCEPGRCDRNVNFTEIAQLSFATNYDDGNWYKLRLEDFWGRVTVKLNGTPIMEGVAYNSGGQQLTATQLVPRTKAIAVFSNTVVRFDDLKITSFDFKPIAYLSDFERDYNDWFQWTLGGSCDWQIGTPTSGPSSARSGSRVAATNLAGNYPASCDQDLYRSPAIDTQPSLLRWSFPFVHLFAWQAYPASQTRDCTVAARGNATSRFYVLEANVFPLDENGQPITAPDNNYNIPPNAYDATCTNTSTFFSGRRAFTNSHNAAWTEIAYPIPEQNNAVDVAVELVFASSAPNEAAGYYVDDPAIYPGGLWERETTPTGPGTCQSGAYCFGTVDNANYSDYQVTALETPAVVTPSYTQELILSWHQWRDFEGTATYYDGGYVEYSTDNGATWTQFKNEELSTPYDDCEIGSDPTTCALPAAPGLRNELQGKEGWTFDDKNWVQITATLEGAAYASKEIRFRFVFGTDESVTARGWFIDNVMVEVVPEGSYDWVEVYNPTPYSVNLNNWRLQMEHSYQDTPNPYDVITADTGVGSGSAVIGPYGYAIITANAGGASKVYENGSPDATCASGGVCDGPDFTIPAESASARRLTIDDSLFGTRGLRFKFGRIRLLDDAGNLVDELGYNLVFYDDLEDYTGASQNRWRELYTVQHWGNPLRWSVGTPTSANGPGRDNTRNSPGTGKSFYLCNNAAETTCEDYNQLEETALLLPALDLRNSSGATPPSLEFFLWNNVDNNKRRDGTILEASTAGGVGDFIQDPPTPDPIQIPGTSLSPGYHTQTINVGGNVINGLYAYSRDITVWTRVTGNLSPWAGQVLYLRFLFGGGNGASVGGPFLDDIAVYYDWVNLRATLGPTSKILPTTLERVQWQGDGNSPGNWARSVAPYNAPPTIGTPNQRNSVTPLS